MPLQTEPYLTQTAHWPKTGRHILAQFDDETVTVYQAYRPEIGQWAAQHGWFGGAFSFSRMSWVKPNFLWMMYRSGWGVKDGQEVTLAVSLRREAFDTLLRRAVHSTFLPEIYGDEAAWKNALAHSDVRLQWDPDHDPSGAKVERRAIQLGMRGETLTQYAHEWIVRLEDVSAFVAEQREHAQASDWAKLRTPREGIYSAEDAAVAAHLQLDE